MNYYDARELADKSGWHYTCMNDGRIWGVGYDGKFQECPSCQGRSWGVVDGRCDTCQAKGYIEVEPHPPHPTKEEAYACATQYMLNTARWDVTVDTKTSVPRCEFPECSTLVHDGRGVSYGFGMSHISVLCPEHRNRVSLAEIAGGAGVTISS